MSKQNLSFINGNHQRYLKTSPSVMVLGKMNDVALAHLKKQTGLNFKENNWPVPGYIVEKTTWQKVSKIFLTYNFKSRYYDNWNYKNTLMLKFSSDEDWNL